MVSAATPIRLLHVGVGVRGRHWLEIVAKHPDFTSAACVDREDVALEQARRCPGQEHGCFVTSLTEAVARTKPDAALISTPTFAHAESVIQALDAGLPVLVEKPLAGSLADAMRVVRHAQAVSRPVMVAENYRFYQAERTLRDMLSRDVAGRLQWVDCVDRRAQPSSSQGSWVRSMDHPFLTEIAVHHFDSFRYLFGRRPAAIFAASFNPPDSSYDREAAASAVIELEGGLPIQYGGTMTAARYEFALWIEGEKGDLWTDRRRVWWRPRGSRFFRPCRSVPVPKGDELPYPKAGTVSLLNQFRDAVRQGRTPETSADDNLWTIAMVEASISSHRQGRRVAIDEVFDPAARREAGLRA
jgi:predicted dehydrogenase